MKIKKIGHCCMIVETKGVRIMTDPGVFSSAQDNEKDIDYVFITHEHPDHIHTDSVKRVLENNPEAIIVTNKSVGKILDDTGIKYELFEGDEKREYKGISIESFENKHEQVYDFLDVQVTGYFFDNRFYYGGDSFDNPNREIEILALPVEGPWMSSLDAIEFAKEIKPKYCFNVHDSRLAEGRQGGSYKMPEFYLSKEGIEFRILKDGESWDFGEN